MADANTDRPRRAPARRLAEAVLKAVGLFVILEPVWMLLPFAGFLYGSVLHIETLGRNPYTAWLTHFVFPVLTLGWLGPVLVAAGLALFLIGAGQIYWAKIRRSGLVTGGLYRFVRHPQYVSLTLLGVGLLLTWGRAITFLAFFIMMFLYYYLAKSEERTCLRLFGPDYERYGERTSFLFPGDRLLRPLRSRLPTFGLPAPLRVAGAFLAAMAACFALMWLIDAVKVAVRVVPYLAVTVPLGAPEGASTQPPITAGEAGGVPFVQAGRLAVARGPYRNAWASGFAEDLLRRLRRSDALKEFLAFLDDPAGDAAIVFCGPLEKPEHPGRPASPAAVGAVGRGPPPDAAGPDRVRLVLLRCALAPGADIRDALADKSRRVIRGGCIAPVNLGRPEAEDIVEGDVVRPGPGFPGEERWDFFIRQFAAQRAALPQPPAERAALVPGRAAEATLVLVRAPILRTRLDPAFAKEILDSLVASARFRDRLRKVGAGDRVVAVAFPRPGPDWYTEHHGQPQVSVFVILAQLGTGAGLDGLFRPADRELVAAFTAEVDFKVPPPNDRVDTFATIGPRRDLEERWRFFLSGVGGKTE